MATAVNDHYSCVAPDYARRSARECSGWYGGSTRIVELRLTEFGIRCPFAFAPSAVVYQAGPGVELEGGGIWRHSWQMGAPGSPWRPTGRYNKPAPTFGEVRRRHAPTMKKYPTQYTAGFWTRWAARCIQLATGFLNHLPPLLLPACAQRSLQVCRLWPHRPYSVAFRPLPESAVVESFQTAFAQAVDTGGRGGNTGRTPPWPFRRSTRWAAPSGQQ